MSIDDVFDLRSQGLTAEAYEAARSLYAADKSPRAATAMYLSAADMRRQLMSAGDSANAHKIDEALRRLLTHTPKHLLLGIWGEEEAASYLRQSGYILLERDWHSKHRDIDVIALHDGVTVFVEVKTRRNRIFTEPEDSVDYQKLRNLRLAINHYLQYSKTDGPWRFDVVTVVGELGSRSPDISHLQDFSLL